MRQAGRRSWRMAFACRNAACLASSSRLGSLEVTQGRRRFDGSSFGWAAATAASLAAACAGTYQLRCSHDADAVEYHDTRNDVIVLGEPTPGLPTLRLEEVRSHVSKETGGIWVIYRHGVYDVTNFVDSHPGGKDKIMMAAGGSVEPFWKVFAIHKDSQSVRSLLETFRIGNLHPEDVPLAAKPRKQPKKYMEDSDPFAHEPDRPLAGMGLDINSSQPFNAETNPQLLTSHFYTPNDLHYKRNHLAVPHIPAKDVESGRFRLEVSGLGLGGKRVAYTVDDLKHRLPQVTVPVTLQCAGNRRQQMSEARQVRGLSWRDGAIGTARWTGVRLRDLLKDAGVDPDGIIMQGGANPELGRVLHVQAEGADCDITGKCYGASVPAHKALYSSADVIIAHSMNDEELPADHGYPLRLIAPGVVGARQVKWLNRIVLAEEESPSHWYQHDYKSFSPSADPSKLPYETAASIQDLPIQGQVCEPKEGAVLPLGEVEVDGVPVRGYAYSGGGRKIVRVDVSADGGDTWTEAELEEKPADAAHQAKRGRDWTWTLWSAEVPVPQAKLQQARKGGKGAAAPKEADVEIVCRAVDDQYQVYPESCMHIWNPRGLLNTSWGRRKVKVAREEDYEDPVELGTVATSGQTGKYSAYKPAVPKVSPMGAAGRT